MMMSSSYPRGALSLISLDHSFVRSLRDASTGARLGQSCIYA
jgi:hypothetical protein